MDYKLQTTDCRLRTANCAFGDRESINGTSMAAQCLGVCETQLELAAAWLTMWVVCCEGPLAVRHLSSKSIIRVKYISTSNNVSSHKLENANETARNLKKPKLYYPMFTISLQILTLALPQTHIYTCKLKQSHLGSNSSINIAFKSFIRCTHKTNDNKAPRLIKRNKRHLIRNNVSRTT